jgi:glycosyltransferase involved in cell wall biosynthesis
MTSTLTVLIATHNRAELLDRALRYINEARRPLGWEIDVLVAANACTDGTHALLEQYDRDVPERGPAKGRLRLHWIAEPRAGKSYALNAAIPLIVADRTAFVDDDHRVDAAYFEGIRAAVDTFPEADIFCGRILPDWDGSEPGWVHDQGPYRIYPLPVPRYDLGDQPVRSPQATATPGGGNLVLRTSLFKIVGDFSVDYGPVGRSLAGAEDQQWVLRGIAAGAAVQYVPGIVQYHYVDQTRLRTSYLLEKAYERSASVVRLAGASRPGGSLPTYLVRKAAQYGLAAIFASDGQKRRFYMVRLAASLGEIKGSVLAARDRRRASRRDSRPDDCSPRP